MEVRGKKELATQTHPCVSETYMSTGDASIFARVSMNAFSDSSVWVLVASEAWTFAAAAFVDLAIFLSSGSFAVTITTAAL